MSRRHTAHRPPRAHLDPIESSVSALVLISMAMHDPMQPEVIAFLLDHTGRGGTIVVVTGADEPDSVVPVVETMCLAAEAEAEWCRLVVASIRPGGSCIASDVDRWFEASDIALDHGVELIEWFVIGPDGPQCPRDLMGEPERW